MFDEIGHDAIGEIDEGTATEVTYPPLSRILSGGTMQAPRELPQIGIDLAWDDDTPIGWDDDTNIAWEAR